MDDPELRRRFAALTTAHLAGRQQAPALTFREHLRAIGGAIEE